MYNLSINRNSKLSDLVEKISLVTKIDLEEIKVIKKSLSYTGYILEVVNKAYNLEHSLYSSKVYEGITLYVEKASQTHRPWEAQFERDQNQMTVKFNDPDNMKTD